MPDPGPSPTARRVAAYRVGFERLVLDAGTGDPGGDDRLAADVAAGADVDRSGPMGRYLRQRTAFFDRVVVNALDRGTRQVVLVGAGYDGRALRYRTPGVRWFEVDRPATQADKVARLTRLHITHDDVTYVPLDLDGGGLSTALLDAQFEADGSALFLAEGVVTYLEPETLADVLTELRALSTVGDRFALSLPRSAADPTERERFEAGVAALGEPAVGSVTAEGAAATFAETRWRLVDLSERSRASGFVMAAPVFSPAPPGTRPTVGHIGRFLEAMLHREGDDGLAEHLGHTYGVPVTRRRELDVGVHRVERADGSTWVARVFPAGRPTEAAVGDAKLLERLARASIPAERTAAEHPVSTHAGQPVLVTTFVPGRRPAADAALFEQLGQLLARIHRLPADEAPANRPGGAWHHLLPDASPYEELPAARRLLRHARHRVAPDQGADYEILDDALAALDLPADLPAAFVHPDFVARNVLRSPDGRLTVLDWAGAGRGPRVVSLGCLLWSAAGQRRSIDAAVRGYRSTIALEPIELASLEAAMAVRPLILAVWTFATGRSDVATAAASWTTQRRRIASGAARARTQLATDAG